jgi:hypothetical protein
MAQPSGAAAAADAPWRAEVARLESELRAARESAARTVAASVSSTGASTPGASGSRASATSPSDAELLRQVRALIAQSEKREQTELALRIAQVVRDNQAERTADLAKVERLLNYTQTNATFEAARNREMINGLAMRVSQTVR